MSFVTKLAIANVSSSNQISLSAHLPHGILDLKTFDVLLSINVVTLPMAVAGILANLTNMAVFARQGLRESTTISLFSLALSDVLTCLCLVWTTSFILPWHRGIDYPILPWAAQTIGCWQLGAFAYNSCWIATYISVERCLCVVKPHKVHFIFTPKLTICAVTMLFVVNLATLVPFHVTISLEKLFDLERNKSLLHLIYNPARKIGLTISYSLHIFMEVGSFVGLITATIALIVSLKRKTKWRAQVANTSSEKEQGGNTDLSLRDKHVINMVITISTIIILSVTPALICNCVALIEPEFEMEKRYERIFIVSWSHAYFFLCFNASVNIFIFYRMSERYRETFRSFCACLIVPK